MMMPFFKVPKKIEGNFAKANLVVGGEDSGGMFGFSFGNSAELSLYSATGEVLYTAEESYSEWGSAEIMQLEAMIEFEGEEEMEQEEKPSSPLDSIKLELSEIDQMYSQLGQSIFESEMPQVSKDLEAMLLKPTEHDPLSFVVSPALIQLAKASNKNLIASLTIQDLGFTMRTFRTGATMSAIHTTVQGNDNLTVTEDDRWLLVEPKIKFKSREAFVPRQRLEAFLNEGHQNGIVRLDSRAVFRASTKVEPTSLAQHPAVSQFVGTDMFGEVSNGVTGERLWGMMSASNRRQVREGQRVPLSSIGNGALNELHEIVFLKKVQLSPVEEALKRKATGIEAMFSMMESMGQPTNFFDEPTEAVPNGVQRAGFITAQVIREPALVFKDPADMRMPRGMGIDMMAMISMFAESFSGTEMDEDGEIEQTMSMQGVMATQERMLVTVVVSPGTSATFELVDFIVDPSGKKAAMNGLPVDMKNQVDAKVEEMKKSPLFMGMMSMGSLMGGSERIDPAAIGATIVS